MRWDYWDKNIQEGLAKVARQAWKDRRRHNLPDELIRAMLASTRHIIGSTPVSSFFEEYTKDIADRWVCSAFKSATRGKKLSGHQRKHLIQEMRGDTRSYLQNAMHQSYREKIPLLEAYRIQLAHLGAETFEKSKWHIADRDHLPIDEKEDPDRKLDKRGHVAVLLYRTRHGNDEAYAELESIFDGVVKHWASKTARSEHLSFDDTYQLGRIGLWKAARSAMSSRGFVKYAKLFMNGEISRHKKAEARIPGVRFGVGETNLEERIGDMRAAEDFRIASDEVREKTLQANRQLGFIDVSEEDHCAYPMDRYMRVPKNFRRMRRLGVNMVRNRLSTSEHQAHLLFLALEGYVSAPQVQEDGTMTTRQEFSHLVEVRRIIDQFEQLSKQEQAAVARYGFGLRALGAYKRPLRMRDVVATANLLGIPHDEPEFKLRGTYNQYTKHWSIDDPQYDPWIGKRVHTMRIKGDLERRVARVITNLMPTREYWGATEAVHHLESFYPGMHKLLRSRGYLIAGTTQFCARRIPQSMRAAWNYLGEADPEVGQLQFVLASPTGGRMRRVLVLPTPKLPDEECTSLMEGIAAMREVRAPGVLKVYDQGLLQPNGKGIPYAIIELPHRTLIGDVEPRLMDPYEETADGVDSRLQRWYDILPGMRAAYQAAFLHNVLPPAPSQENIFLPPLPKRVGKQFTKLAGFTIGSDGWRRLDAQDDVQALYQERMTQVEEFWKRAISLDEKEQAVRHEFGAELEDKFPF